MTGFIEPMVGRYVHVEIENAVNRIYFEENGSGIPLVCLHTAGSDARQWRHMLADVNFTKNFRIIAFDMPWHGKSNPPDGWTGDEYRLTTARYTETIRAFCKALSLDRPVVMGCSIGGTHRSQSRNRPRRRIPGADWARSCRLPDSMVRYHLAKPSGRSWGRSLRCAGLWPDRSARPGRSAAGNIVGVQARRAGRL